MTVSVRARLTVLVALVALLLGVIAATVGIDAVGDQLVADELDDSGSDQLVSVVELLTLEAEEAKFVDDFSVQLELANLSFALTELLDSGTLAALLEAAWRWRLARGLGATARSMLSITSASSGGSIEWLSSLSASAFFLARLARVRSALAGSLLSAGVAPPVHGSRARMSTTGTPTDAPAAAAKTQSRRRCAGCAGTCERPGSPLDGDDRMRGQIPTLPQGGAAAKGSCAAVGSASADRAPRCHVDLGPGPGSRPVEWFRPCSFPALERTR